MEIGATKTAANVVAQYAKAPREMPPPQKSADTSQAGNARVNETRAQARSNAVSANNMPPRVNEARTTEAPPRPVVNAQGQTTGRIINTSA